MKFYEIKATIEEEKVEEEKVEKEMTEGQEEQQEVCSNYRRLFHKQFTESREQAFIFLSSVWNGEVEGAAITSEASLESASVEKLLKACEINMKPQSLSINECNSYIFGAHLQEARSNRLIGSADHIIEAFSPLDEIFSVREVGIWRRENFYQEHIAVCGGREKYQSEAKQILWASSLLPELERIYAKPAVEGVSGIPVQYLLCGNDYDTREKAADILISALYENHRIQQKRYCEIFVSRLDYDEADKLLALFKTYEGGAIVFRFRADARKEHGMADASVMTISNICRAINRYKNKVQVLFCFPLACEKEKEIFFEQLGGISFVTLEEGMVDRVGAVQYLADRADRDHYTDLAGLEEQVHEERCYRSHELDRIYDEWSAGYLKRVVYPQYADVLSIEREELAAAPVGNAYEKLQRMIGLGSAKQVIDDALHYFKAQKLLEARNKKTSRASMHMVFTGNPGTAKTTVARLFAEIMRDNKILAEGHMVEVGRGDLVGKYVGWTAQTVQKKFAEARGGVLFIDEAYSLVDDRSGSFGDEAINTIVQEMENNRNDVIVVFAGYPDKMEGFLAKNPGLRSRIAFHVPFEDYTPEELCRMTALMANDKELVLDEGVSEKLYGIYRSAVGSSDFGNGRFVRNLLERASMRQATRLMQSGAESFTDDALSTLVPDDFLYEPAKAQKTAKIGFAV